MQKLYLRPINGKAEIILEIEHDSPTPKYIQIMDYVRQNIKSGSFKSNVRLPSERQLAEQFSVSRLTVTKALKELEQKGLIYTQIGKGTFVTPQTKIDQYLETLSSFTEEMEAKQQLVSSHVLYAGVEGAKEDVANALLILPGTKIFSLKRVRMANNQILALEHSHVLYSLCPGILDNHDFSHESLYGVLSTVYQLRLTTAHQTVEARLATPIEAKTLQITPNAPVLSLSRVTLNSEQIPVEFVSSVYPGDRYKFHVTLKATSQI
jgi:GntR family transcriptional regulator